MTAGHQTMPYLALSEAVSRWFEYYEAEFDEEASKILCDAAIEFFKKGYRSPDDLATMLIGTYVGVGSTRVNAPTSNAIH